MFVSVSFEGSSLGGIGRIEVGLRSSKVNDLLRCVCRRAAQTAASPLQPEPADGLVRPITIVCLPCPTGIVYHFDFESDFSGETDLLALMMAAD